MCEKTSVLTIFLILKILVLFIVPVIIIFLKFKYTGEKKKLVSIISIVEVLLLLLLIVLKITNNSCVINSSISTINRIKGIDGTTTRVVATQEEDQVFYVTPEITLTRTNTRVLHYNNSKLPLSDKSINCNKEIYMKNFGSSITALASIVSTAKNDVIDPIQILDLALSSKIFDCDKGVDFDALKNVVQSKYNIIIREISQSEVESNISRENVVLEKIKYNPNATNLTCNEGYILIYDKTNDGSYEIININRKSNLTDYICPETTPGRYTTIKQESSDKKYSLSELDSIASKYYVVEGVN